MGALGALLLTPRLPPCTHPPRRRDLVLDLELVLAGEPLSPRVWRRLRVSGGTPLPALADKVLLPAMVRGGLGGQAGLGPPAPGLAGRLAGGSISGAMASLGQVGAPHPATPDPGRPLGTCRPSICARRQGWVRNYHAHLYTDYQDGALLGDKE